MKIAHIVNPCSVSEKSDLYIAQPITFESIKRAQDYASSSLDIQLLSAQFNSDRDIIPQYFELTPDLERSVLDIAPFQHQRNLPLHRDILDRLYEYSNNADYLIYTNADIAVKPDFYMEVNRLINIGLDAFVITRRTIDKKYTSPIQLDEMYQEEGKPHPGHDCFVFSRRLYPKFDLKNVCIGAAWFDKSLLWNMIAHCSKFKAFKNLKLTFHIGNDKHWKNPASREYSLHNKAEVKKVIESIEASFGEAYRNPDLWPYLEHVYEKKMNFHVPGRYEPLKNFR
jgi:hypothetical protein